MKEEDERRQRTQEAHADAAEIMYDGLKAEACDLARDEDGRYLLEGPTLTGTIAETGHLTSDCPRTGFEQAGDKLSALTLGTCLLVGFGAAKASAWLSDHRRETEADGQVPEN